MPANFPLNIKRTALGVVRDVSRLFEGFAYRTNHTDRKPHGRGSWTDHLDGEYFLSISPHSSASVLAAHGFGWRQWEQGIGENPLYCKPTVRVISAAKRGSPNGAVGSFSLVPWQHTGHALVVARDAAYIARPWIAFIPFECLKQAASLTLPPFPAAPAVTRTVVDHRWPPR